MASWVKATEFIFMPKTGFNYKCNAGCCNGIFVGKSEYKSYHKLKTSAFLNNFANSAFIYCV